MDVFGWALRAGRIALAAALLGALCARAGAEDFLTPPYLQNVKTTGITILWELQDAVEAEVAYGTSTAYNATATAETLDSGANTTIYRAVLTDLEPGATYHYRVLANGAALTGDRTFITAPAAPKPFTFTVWSDSQGQNAKANPEDPLEPTKAMMAHMAQRADIAVTSGDLAERGDTYEDTRRYYLDRVALYLGQTVPWFNAWGNHDAGRGAAIRLFADMPSKDRPGFDPGWGSFNFEYAGVHFVCIDYNTMHDDIGTWLEGVLDSDMNRNARFTFLFVHVPPYCELWIDGDQRLRETLVPLMTKYGVDACFSGHTHEYERGYLDGVHYIVTGSGSWLDHGEPIIKDWAHMYKGGVHHIEGFQHGLVNEYVEVAVGEDSWEATVHGFNPDGSYLRVIDTFGSTMPDTDGDGLLDDQETFLGSDPNEADADGDGLPDPREVITVGSDPMNPDTDGDRVSDYDEAANGTDPVTAPAVLLSETFDALRPRLQPAEDESIDASLLGWTHQTPDAWRVVRAGGMPQGTAEWQGWSFATMDFWTAAENQGRDAFTRANGVLAIADPDEWDDTGSPAKQGAFDSSLVSPAVPVKAGQRTYLRFDTSYRQEAFQTGDVLYAFDGGTAQILARFDETVENRRVALEIPAPATDAELQVTWRLHNAGNNWFWAVDNAELSDEPAVERGPSPFGTRRAVIIGVDGMRVDSMLAANTPNIDALAAEGAYSWEAVASKGQATSSGPGWSSILTGVWVEKHGVTDNSFEGARYDAYPHLFTLLRRERPAAFLSSIVNWSPIHHHILADADWQRTGLKDEEVARVASEHIVDVGPDVLFVHLDELDGAGHASGYQPESAHYLETVERMDRYVGQIRDAVERRMQDHPGEEWLLVLVSDHGGTVEKGHGGLSPEEVTIPFVVWGGGTTPGALSGEVALTDVVPTVMAHLGFRDQAVWAFDGAPRGQTTTELARGPR